MLRRYFVCGNGRKDLAFGTFRILQILVMAVYIYIYIPQPSAWYTLALACDGLLVRSSQQAMPKKTPGGFVSFKVKRKASVQHVSSAKRFFFASNHSTNFAPFCRQNELMHHASHMHPDSQSQKSRQFCFQTLLQSSLKKHCHLHHPPEKITILIGGIN